MAGPREQQRQAELAASSRRLPSTALSNLHTGRRAGRDEDSPALTSVLCHPGRPAAGPRAKQGAAPSQCPRCCPTLVALKKASAPISAARSAAAVSVVKKGLPVPAPKITTRPCSRWRIARRRMYGSAICAGGREAGRRQRADQEPWVLKIEAWSHMARSRAVAWRRRCR